jgi:diguanylate cyclase (GGDEF)-like protein/PAS domain S-box-containing protein
MLKLVLAAVIAGFLLSAVYISALIVERQNTLKQVSRYNISWLASQAVSEFIRLGQRLNAFAVPGSGVDKDEVQLRFEILLSRSKLLNDGEFQAFVQLDPERQATVRSLDEVLAAVEPYIHDLDAPGAALAAYEILQPLESKLTGLASAANHYGAQRVAEDQQELIRLHWLFSSLAACLIVFGIVLLALLGWHNRLLGRAHKDLRALAANLQATSSELEQANKALGNAYAELRDRNEVLQMQELELRMQNDRFDAALNNMSHGLCMADADGRIAVFNARFAELFGLDPKIKPGTTLEDLADWLDESSAPGAAAFRQICMEQKRFIENRRRASFIHDRPGGPTFSISHQPMARGGWIATYEDITERRRAETLIAYMAHHDALTGLANRVLFRERLDQALESAQLQKATIAVLCLDLDRFKDVNDSLGHEKGDALLKAVADRLKGCIREGDLVARLGGDEFAVLRVARSEPHNCAALASRIINSLSEPYHIEGHEIVIGTSVGIALAAKGGLAPDQLLKHADLALYRAKSDRR